MFQTIPLSDNYESLPRQMQQISKKKSKSRSRSTSKKSGGRKKSASKQVGVSFGGGEISNQV